MVPEEEDLEDLPEEESEEEELTRNDYLPSEPVEIGRASCRERV